MKNKTAYKIPVKIVLREYFESIIVAVLLALFIRFFIISPYKIPTVSMFPTLKVGDFIFAYKLPYGVPIPFTEGERWAAKVPARGDVVVFRYPNNPKVNYVKRVVGLPGDRIRIRNRKLYVNEKEAVYESVDRSQIADLPGNEYYSPSKESIDGSTHLVINSESNQADFFGPTVVPPDSIFVLGDNRDSSDDSRYWGTVPMRNLEGQVVMIWMSFDWMNRWASDRFPSIRLERIFKNVE